MRFFKIASSGDTLPHLNWLFYVITLVLVIPVAGAVAVAWKSESEWKALWVGASCPALIATIVQTVPTIPK
ncbi:MAG TPA: hypothetical protein VGN17_17400 [Bryobacteraceae bacterium]|jgi:uncharacterized membrane protein